MLVKNRLDNSRTSELNESKFKNKSNLKQSFTPDFPSNIW